MRIYICTKGNIWASIINTRIPTTLIGMSNLIPEKRVNKRGVAVTKHVRATPAATKSKDSMPPPALVSARKTKGKSLTKKQLEPNYNSLLRSQFKTDAELQTAIKARYGYPRLDTLFVFTCSDAEVYDVISAVGLTNAGALLGDAGIRSKEDALEFLSSTGLDHLATDSSGLTAAALNRGIPAHDVFYMYKKSFTESGDNPDIKLLLDSAEAHSHKGLRDMKVIPPIHERVADAQISMDDLRIIGPTRFVKATDSSGFLIRQVMKLQSGLLDHDAQQIKEAIIRRTNAKDSIDQASVLAELRVANDCGYEFASTLRNPQLVARVVHAFESQPEDKLRAAAYAEAIGNAVKSRPSLSVNKVVPLFKAGVDPMLAVEHLDRDIPVEQIIAIEAEGIAPSVSGGWL